MGCLNGKKNSNSYCSSEANYRLDKKVQLEAKNVRLETRGFRATFLLLTTPYVMFEWKKTQILIAHEKQTKDRTKKAEGWFCVLRWKKLKFLLLIRSKQ